MDTHGVPTTIKVKGLRLGTKYGANLGLLVYGDI